jgi:hypothetical protein
MIPHPADMLAPAGLLTLSLFPGEGAEAVNTRLTSYINDGVTRAGGGPEADYDSVLAWAYHRAFMAVYVRLTTSPAQGEVDDAGKYQYLITQINNVKTLADEWLTRFEELTTTAEATDEQQQGTRSTPAQFVF